MPLYGPSTATATVAANTNVVTIAGMDLNVVVQQGMTINFGARDRTVGDAWIINTVVPNGTNGGTLTTAGSIPTAYNSAPFVIDTRGFNGTDSSFAAAVSLKLLATLTTLLGTATNLFAGSRQLVLDKVASTAIARIAFAIAGRTWGDIAQRSLTYTPTGSGQVAIETLAIRAFADGSTSSDALLIDLTSGTGDLRKNSATMAAASTVDLGSAPTGKVAIVGNAAINSFGSGKNLERLVHIVDGGNTIAHNATTLALPGRASIVTRPGDCFHATSDGAGNWQVRSYDRADGTPLTFGDAVVAFKNRLINPSFAINCRRYAFGSAIAAGLYGLDRWKAGASGCTLTAQGGVPDVSITVSGGSLVQIVEGRNVEGGSATLSWAGTAQARIGINGAAPTGAYASSPITVSGVNAGGALTVEFGAGTLLRPQLEFGATATAYERRPRAIDELLCQRYARALDCTNGRIYIAHGYYADGGQLSFSIPLTGTPLRAPPSISFIGAANSDYGVSSNGGDQSGFSFAPTGNENYVVVVANKAGHGLSPVPTTAFFIKTSGAMILSAEL